MRAEAKRKALAELAAAYVSFKETVRGIPDEKLSIPMHGEWSAKDLIAHVSSWNEAAALDMHRVSRGHIPFLAAFREADVDEWNAFFVRGRKLFPPSQVYYELESCYDMLVEGLEAVPQALFEQGGMVTNVLAIAVHHYRDHGDHIRQWRDREGL